MVARDLNSMVSDSRNRSTSARCSDAVHGEQRNEKARKGSVNESEGRWRARETSWATWRRHRRPGNRDRPPRRQRHRDGRLRRHYCDVQHRKKYGRGEGETDMWGPRVRKFLYSNPNFWIVTILPPKRNLVPRFRRKVPN